MFVKLLSLFSWPLDCLNFGTNSSASAQLVGAFQGAGPGKETLNIWRAAGLLCGAGQPEDAGDHDLASDDLPVPGAAWAAAAPRHPPGGPAPPLVRPALGLLHQPRRPSGSHPLRGGRTQVKSKSNGQLQEFLLAKSGIYVFLKFELHLIWNAFVSKMNISHWLWS